MKNNRKVIAAGAGGNEQTARGRSAVEEGDPPLAPMQALRHDPNVKPGSVDVTGIVPDDVHVDPEILEGRPGYEESGASGVLQGKLPAQAEGPTESDR